MAEIFEVTDKASSRASDGEVRLEASVDFTVVARFARVAPTPIETMQRRSKEIVSSAPLGGCVSGTRTVRAVGCAVVTVRSAPLPTYRICARIYVLCVVFFSMVEMCVCFWLVLAFADAPMRDGSQ